MIDTLFIILSLMIIFFATLVVTLPNILHCALALMASLFGSAGLYILLNAEMTALAQVAVYIGGVVIFIIFAIFLTTRMGEKTTPSSLPKIGWGLVLSSFAFAGFYGFYAKYLNSVSTTGYSTAEDGSMSAVGKILLNTGSEGLIIPFEIVSVLLLMTVIGAVVIARAETKALNCDSESQENI